jgi:hypothetical protein
MLTASMTTYFSVLDLGFGGSIVKFVAYYRAKRDARGLNEIASTLFVIFGVVGVVAYGVFLLVAFNIGRVFNITPEQADTGRKLMLVIGVYVSLGFPFSIFGGIINGFQRYDLNNLVGVCSSVIVAFLNVVMLLSGASLVQLVMATTSVRIATYFIYRLNAYHVFRELTVRPSLFLWSRVSELTSFSVYVAIIDWANKLNYSIDAIIIGAYLSASAVALWTVPQRLAEMLQRLTNQFNGVLFPVVVDSEAGASARAVRAGDAALAGQRDAAGRRDGAVDGPADTCVDRREVRREHRRRAGSDLRRRHPRRQRHRDDGAQRRRAAPAARVCECRRGARQRRAEPAVGAALRAHRPGVRYAAAGGDHLDCDRVAGGVPPCRDRRRRSIPLRGLADHLAARRDGDRVDSFTRCAAGAAVRRRDRRRGRRAHLRHRVSGIGCEAG